MAELYLNGGKFPSHNFSVILLLQKYEQICKNDFLIPNSSKKNVSIGIKP